MLIGMARQSEKRKAARCPKCGGFSYRRVADLDADDRIIFDRLPASAKYTKKQRGQHLYCPRCGYESEGGPAAA
ncbi:MAG TPA: hypothetical protein PKE66_07180 [Pyrinomonadaceae bacterium]|nr:hypothetical protein [Pyrinomonadaceae bacterium]